MATPGQTKCAHDRCQCQVLADKAVTKDGRLYCSQDCADGKGCNHQNCACGRT